MSFLKNMFGGGEEEEEIDTTDNDVNDSGEGFLTSSMKSVSYLFISVVNLCSTELY